MSKFRCLECGTEIELCCEAPECCGNKMKELDKKEPIIDQMICCRKY